MQKMVGEGFFFVLYPLFIIHCAIGASSDGFLTPDSTLEVVFAARFPFRPVTNRGCLDLPSYNL